MIICNKATRSQSRPQSPRAFWSAPRHGFRILVLTKRHVGSGNEIELVFPLSFALVFLFSLLFCLWLYFFYFASCETQRRTLKCKGVCKLLSCFYFPFLTNVGPTTSFMSRIECKCCLIYLVLHICQGYLTFSYYFIFDRIVCFGDFLPIRTLCDAYHKEFESH